MIITHGHLRFARHFVGRSGGAAMVDRDVRDARQAPPPDNYGAVSVCLEGTATAGRRRRVTESRWSGKSLVKLSLNGHLCFADQHL